MIPDDEFFWMAGERDYLDEINGISQGDDPEDFEPDELDTNYEYDNE